VPKLPVLSGEELIKALKKAGFEVVRQRGSHVSLTKGEYHTVVPCMMNWQKALCPISSSNPAYRVRT
jgi:predicted RNA binding protein YcfA (HicA-like mRNA interferase family)